MKEDVILTAVEAAQSLRAELDSLKKSGVNDIFIDQSVSKFSDKISTLNAQPTIEAKTMPKAKAKSSKAAENSDKTDMAHYPDAVIAESVAAKRLSEYPGERAEKLAKLAAKVAKCDHCPLCSTRTNTVYSRGNPNSPLMLIGEAPGADEDKHGFPFVGRAGKLLDEIVSKGMKYDPDNIYICNVLKCRPPGNRNPEPIEIERCKGYLEAQIEIIDPIVIIAVGKFGAQWLLDSDSPIGKLRGKMWDVNGRKVVCTYHPAYLLRNPSAKSEVWKDVQIVMDYFGRDKPLPMRE